MEEAGRADVRSEIADETLLARYAAGDVEAFEVLFRRYEGRAYEFFLRRTGSRERAEDLYQELFLRIHGARHAYDPSRSFLPWFFQIARHLLSDDARRAFRRREVRLEDRELPSGASDVERALADRERVGELLAGLGPVERYVLVASKVEGAGYPELASHLGKSVDAVKKMASRTLQRVRASRAAPRPRPSVG